MAKINWRCPFCEHRAVIHDQEYGTMSSFRHQFHHGNQYEHQSLRGTVIVCPNAECRQYTVEVTLHDNRPADRLGNYADFEAKRKWRLIPDSEARSFPDYIPEPILEDYRQACLIRDLSPKASATLSRRCLQGIIRDFWGVTKPKLIQEIEAIKDKTNIETWEAIDAVRHIGNIGAHMEKDINLVIDVDPQEARLLIELIETLLDDWYVARHEREYRMRKLKAVAAEKKEMQNNPPA